MIDAGKRAAVATIKLDGKPEFAVSDGKGHVLVNIESKLEVAQLDGAHGESAVDMDTWQLGGA